MKRRRLFDFLYGTQNDGPGVSKEDAVLKPTLWNLPKAYGRKFTKLLNLNFCMLPIWVIPFVCFYIYSTSETMPSQTSGAFSSVFGMNIVSPSPLWTSLLGIHGFQSPLHTFGTARLIVVIVLGLLLAVLWGWINVGATYICRSMFRGEPVFIWSDFIYAIKKNLWQGLGLGLMDFAACALLVADLVYFSSRSGSLMLDFFFFAICAITAIYMFMRYYMYMILVTFNIKTLKLLKNSLIFSILGIKRNLIGFLAIFVVIAINAALVLMCYAIQFSFIGVFIILPFIYLLPTVVYFKAYAAYPVIEKYMIN